MVILLLKYLLSFLDCPEKCRTCTSNTACLTCNTGYVLQNDMCDVCPTGTYLQGQTCQSIRYFYFNKDQ